MKVCNVVYGNCCQNCNAVENSSLRRHISVLSCTMHDTVNSPHKICHRECKTTKENYLNVCECFSCKMPERKYNLQMFLFLSSELAHLDRSQFVNEDLEKLHNDDPDSELYLRLFIRSRKGDLEKAYNTMVNTLFIASVVDA